MPANSRWDLIRRLRVKRNLLVAKFMINLSGVNCLTLCVTVNKGAVRASTAYPQKLLPGMEQL